MKNKQTIAGYLPLFTGFYNSMEIALLEDRENDEFESIYNDIEEQHPDWNEEQIKEEQEKQFKGYDFDYFREEVAKLYVNKVNKRCLDWLNFIYEEIASPKYYNFQNDSINCQVEVDRIELDKYLETNKESFDKYCADNFTSYDGFYSFFP